MNIFKLFENCDIMRLIQCLILRSSYKISYIFNDILYVFYLEYLLAGGMIMSDVLSQNEIDELLSALNTGEIDVEKIKIVEDVKKVKAYDFRRPSKFSKDHIRTLNIIYDNYAKLVSSYLTGYLRTLTQVKIVNIEAITYSDFNNSIQNPTILSIIDMKPLIGTIVYELPPNLTYAFIDTMLGGSGDVSEIPTSFTDIELAIIKKILTQIIGLMKEPWENVMMITPNLERIETNPQFAQITSPNEMVILINLNVEIGEVKGVMNICIPHLVIEPILNKLCTKYWFSSTQKEKNDEIRKKIESKIYKTEVPIKAVMGTTSVKIKEIIDLRIGDVLPLDNRIDGNIKIMIGDSLKFHAKPGVYNNKYALRVTDTLNKEGI